MRILVIGASGFIGGAVALRLIREGHTVCGLVRDPAKAGRLEEAGLSICAGSMDEAPSLARAIAPVGAVINAADSDHAPGVHAILRAVEGTGKTFIHTSGISVCADLAAGADGGAIIDEATAFSPIPERAVRHAIDLAVRSGSAGDSRTMVICCPLIYGAPTWPGRESVQLPHLVNDARERGIAHYVGPGLARWSHAHVDDIAEAYAAALAKGHAGALYYPENGEIAWGELAALIGRSLGIPAGSWSLDDAIQAWGPRALWTYSSNARTRGRRIRVDLGWSPRLDSIEGDIRRLAATLSNEQ